MEGKTKIKAAQVSADQKRKGRNVQYAGTVKKSQLSLRQREVPRHYHATCYLLYPFACLQPATEHKKVTALP